MSDCMWFGTEERMGWIPAPNSGADMNSEAWSVGGTLMSGGGYQSHSWGSHKTYTFEWSNASSVEASLLMKSYRDGSYGRGLLYFIDPLLYTQNILPARLADPSMAIGDESASLVYDADPTRIANSGNSINNLPIDGARYDLAGVPAGHRAGESVFVPIPEGYTLHLTAYYSATGTGGIYASPQPQKGVLSAAVKLTANASSATSPASNSFSGVSGVRVWIGRTSTTASTVSAYGLVGRLAKTGSPAPKGKWVGGGGHSGVRFSTSPTHVAYNSVNGGQVGYAASFREVGSWNYA